MAVKSMPMRAKRMAVTTWPPARLLTTPNRGIGAVG